MNGEARAQAGMGVDSGDYDGDGRLDLVLTAFAHDTNTLYRNLDGTQFEDVSAASGLAARTFERMGWGVQFLDADLDGRLDLFFANGHIFADVDSFPALEESYRQKSQLLLNQGTSFRDVSDGAGSGLAVRKVGPRTRGRRPRRRRRSRRRDLERRRRSDAAREPPADRPPLGGVPAAVGDGESLRDRRARHARRGRKRQLREVRSGGSYLSQSDLRPLFGLGEYAGPVDVEVLMPGGARYRWQGLPSGRLHVLELTDAHRVVERQ